MTNLDLYGGTTKTEMYTASTPLAASASPSVAIDVRTYAGNLMVVLTAQSATGDETLEQLLKNWDPNRLSKALGDLARSQTPGVKFDPESKGRTYIIEQSGVLATVQGKKVVTAPVQDEMTSLAMEEEE